MGEGSPGGPTPTTEGATGGPPPSSGAVLAMVQTQAPEVSHFRASPDYIQGGVQGTNYTGAPDDFAPEMHKRVLENKKEPLKIKKSPWK